MCLDYLLKFKSISEQVETLSCKQTTIRGEDVELAEELKLEVEAMSLDNDKRASPKKTRKKAAIKHEKRKRSQVDASTPEGSQQGGEGGKAPKLSIAKEVKVEKDLFPSESFWTPQLRCLDGGSSSRGLLRFG